jgi:phospholipid/cholesterol/gamma-HCH transport system ATP-binding protein
MNPSHQNLGVTLTVSGLHKSYNGTEVLKGIELEVNPGEIFVIMGPSGCGKSVLLRQLIGLEDPDQGQVLIDGKPVKSREVVDHYRLAMVFQASALWASMTVGQNIGLYLEEHRLKNRAEIKKIVTQELALVGLEGTENKMPYELSGGMRKRVAIARALAIEPQLILYDEPTSELDPLSSVSIAEEISRFNELIHSTTLVVSHDRDLAFGIGHRIAMMHAGLIIAVGSRDEIKRHPDPRVQEFIHAHIPSPPTATVPPPPVAPSPI